MTEPQKAQGEQPCAQQVGACERCGMHVRLAGPRNPDAKLLRRAKEPRGLCINCAVHDWMRNTYPVNSILDEGGPKILLHESVRQQFNAIMALGGADARPDEINWNLIVENWDLPFAKPVKQTALNPYRPGVDRPLGAIHKLPNSGVSLSSDLTIRSFDELNELEPGLGDSLRAGLDRMFDPTKQREPGDVEIVEEVSPKRQKRLFE
jgi:hypothetical protein